MILQFVSVVKIRFLDDEIYGVFLNKSPLQVQYVIQCSRNASNEMDMIKFSIYFGAELAKNNVPGFSTF